MIRERLRLRLDEPNSNSTSPIAGDYQQIYNTVVTNGAFYPDTSTRVLDHRIALIASENVEVCDLTCIGSMVFISRIPELEQKGYAAFCWGGGSDRNIELDIGHNAKRIVAMIYHNGPKTKRELAFALSPSGKHEAFCALIDKMRIAGLIVRDPKKKKFMLPQDLESNTLDDYRVSLLRKSYSPSSAIQQPGLLLEFTDLHPFRIDCRVKWFPSKGGFWEWVYPLVEELNRRLDGTSGQSNGERS